MDRARVFPRVSPMVKVMRAEVSPRPAIRSLSGLSTTRRVLSSVIVSLMSVMPALGGPVVSFRYPCHCWIFFSPLLIPEQLPGWVLHSRMFPEKTPEESDADETPRENRPACQKPGGNKAGISHRFTPRGEDYSCSGMSLYPWFIGTFEQKGQQRCAECSPLD